MLRSLCRAGLGLVVAWWRADRVRISPREGALLQLRPASLLIIGGRPVNVLCRQEVPNVGAPGIRYECRTEDGPACLDVRFYDNAGRLEICWTVSGRTEALREGQIEIFG